MPVLLPGMHTRTLVPPPPTDMAVVHVSVPTSTTTLTITEPELDGQIPTGCIVYAGQQNANNITTNGLRISMGFTDGVRQYAMAMSCANGQSSTVTGRNMRNDQMIYVSSGGNIANPTLVGSFGVFVTNGVRIDFSAATQNHHIVVVLITGAECHANHFVPASGANLVPCGFQPEGVVSMSAYMTPGQFNSPQSEGNLSIGFADVDGGRADDASMDIWSHNAVSTSNVPVDRGTGTLHRPQRTGEGDVSVTGAAATGFNINAATAWASAFAYFAFRGFKLYERDFVRPETQDTEYDFGTSRPIVTPAGFIGAMNGSFVSNNRAIGFSAMSYLKSVLATGCIHAWDWHNQSTTTNRTRNSSLYPWYHDGLEPPNDPLVPYGEITRVGNNGVGITTRTEDGNSGRFMTLMMGE